MMLIGLAMAAERGVRFDGNAEAVGGGHDHFVFFNADLGAHQYRAGFIR